MTCNFTFQVSGTDLYESNRRLLTNLGSCFVQSLHKAQTVFENSAKQEAQLVHLREELAETKASLDKVEAEKKYLVCRLQSSLLENHRSVSLNKYYFLYVNVCLDIEYLIKFQI